MFDLSNQKLFLDLSTCWRRITRLIARWRASLSIAARGANKRFVIGHCLSRLVCRVNVDVVLGGALWSVVCRQRRVERQTCCQSRRSKNAITCYVVLFFTLKKIRFFSLFFLHILFSIDEATYHSALPMPMNASIVSLLYLHKLLFLKLCNEIICCNFCIKFTAKTFAQISVSRRTTQAAASCSSDARRTTLARLNSRQASTRFVCLRRCVLPSHHNEWSKILCEIIARQWMKQNILRI